MNKPIVSVISVICALALSGFSLPGCVVSGHPTAPANWGVPARATRFEEELEKPGPIEVETVASATWKVPLEGMLNLEHPKARDAHLSDVEQPISVYFHALRHPTRGLFIVDTGVERAFTNDREHALVSGFIAKAAKVDTIVVQVDLASWLLRQPQPLSGVFLTHMHLDHIMGMRDVPRGTPIFTGPGEARAGGFMNVFTRPITDRAFEGQATIAEWRFQPDPDERFAGVVDIFGDRSLWALLVPGHTPGSTAYLARTPQGPVLLAGDACHTAWGWEHGVEPGSFSRDLPQSAASLQALEALVKRHPTIEVRLGHQPHGQEIVQ